MKKSNRLSILLAPLLWFSLASSPVFSADVFGPPGTVDYQGTVLDGSGNPLAATASANYEIQFRLYDAQTGGAIVWAEKQLVTVSKGRFSVRLGEGDPILGAGAVPEGSVGHASPGLPGAFNGKERFLGITVVIPGQNPGEIQPRLAFLTSPFSYIAARAQSADRVVQSASDSPSTLNVGSINYVPLVLTSSASLGGANSAILANATAGAVAATLPAGTAAEKKEITVTKTDASANPVTVVPPGGGTINGSATPISLAKRGDSVTLRNTDANNWIVVSRYSGEGTVLADSPIVGGLLARGGVPGVNGVNKNGYAFSGNSGDNDSGLFSTGDGQLALYTNNYSALSINGITGNGTFTGNFYTTNNLSASGTITTNSTMSAYKYYFAFNDIANRIDSSASGPYLVAGNRAMVVTTNYGVGIGGDPDTRAVLRVVGTPSGTLSASYGWLNSSGTIGTNSGSNVYSIWADYRIGGSEFNAFSDARIKRVIGVSDSKTDLANLMKLKVTDYSFVDTVVNGDRKQKKVIAQEVENVYPLAVSKVTNVVPDIMQKATPLADGWITLTTDLKKGERVRIISDGKENEVYEVMEVTAAKDKFRVSFKPTEKDKEVFVYGREVKDFRTVDYDAIAMLNVSATQQVKKDSDTAEEALRKENEALKAKLAAQEERLAALEKLNTTRETRLAALESAVLGKTVSAPPATKTLPSATRGTTPTALSK